MAKEAFDRYSGSSVHRDRITPDHTVRFGDAFWKEAQALDTCAGYAYAANIPALGSCPPGSARCIADSGIPERLFTRDGFKMLLENDGLYDLPDASIPRDNSHILAVRFSPVLHEYLMLRRDDDEGWSYKHYAKKRGCGGMTIHPCQVDFAGQKITDPRTATLGSFTEFGGFYSIPYAGIDIVSRLPEFLDTRPSQSKKAVPQPGQPCLV